MRCFFCVLIFIVGQTIYGQDYSPDSIQTIAPKTYQFYSKYFSADNLGNSIEALGALDSTVKYVQLEMPDNYLLLAQLEYFKAKRLLKCRSIAESESFVRSILKMYEDGARKDKEGEGWILLALADIESTHLNFERCITISNKAISKSNDHYIRACAYTYLTLSHMRLNQLDSAIYYSRKSINTMKINDDTTSIDYVMRNLNLVTLLSAQSMDKDCAKAIVEMDKISINLNNYDFERSAPPSPLGAGYLIMSQTYFDCGAFQKGMVYAKKTLSITKNIKSAEKSYSYALNEMIRSHIYAVNLDSAAYYIRQFLPLQKAHIIAENSLLIEAEKDVYLNRKNNGLQYALAILDEYNHVITDFNEEVYSHAVFLKGFAPRSLSNLQNALFAETDTTIRKSFRDWLNLRDLYHQNLRFEGKVNLDLDSVKNQMNNLEKEFYRITQLKLQNDLIENFEWEAVKSNMDNEELVVDFVRYKGFRDHKWKYGVFIIHSESEFPEYLSLCEEDELNEALKRKQFESEFKYINRIYNSESLLYDLIWSKILSKYTHKNQIYTSSTGLLHGVSHDAILTSKSDGNQNIHEIILINSTVNLLEVKSMEKLKDSLNVLLVGGIDYDLIPEKNEVFGDTVTIHSKNRGRISGNWSTLVHTLIEVERIEKLIKQDGGQVTLFSGQKASEIKFKEEVETIFPDIIHFATHGYFLDDTSNAISVSQAANYTQSGMVMTGANNSYKSQSSIVGYGDGILTAPEISPLNLSKTKLVVLSACQTGLGDLNNIGNAYGLQRAFKIAGIDYIIYSLWKVSDEVTMKFMTLFYQKLMKYKDIKKSFYETKQEIKSSYSVFYWAPFQLIY